MGKGGKEATIKSFAVKSLEPPPSSLRPGVISNRVSSRFMLLRVLLGAYVVYVKLACKVSDHVHFSPLQIVWLSCKSMATCVY